MKNRYSGQQICILVPTKDRPEHVERLLKSLIEQVEQVRCIIIVASGYDIKSTIDKFSDKLSIQYYHTSQTGQIKQRNIGISKLNDHTPLVACIDDDITLDPFAIKEMVQFWNSAPKNTAGVGFNNISGTSSSSQTTIFQQLLLLGHKKPGRVLRSGCSSLISNLHENIKSQWLNGGMTVWKKDILVNNKHKEINTKWAIGEDLIFSYPIGKVFPLYVCASATVSHNHYPYDKEDNKWHFSYGRTQTIWLYYFVNSNKELLKVLFFFTLFIRVFSKYSYGLITRQWNLVNFSLGAISAVVEIAKFEFGLSVKDDIRED
jgi:glycosyltransferase involved in cell wall biosynthesis